MEFNEKDFTNNSIDLKLLSKLLKLYKPYLPKVIMLIVLNILISLISVVYPLFHQYLIDNIESFKNINTVIIYTVVYVILILIATINHYLFFQFASKIESSFNHDLKTKLYRKLLNQSNKYYDVTPTGWIITRINSDVGRLTEIMTWSFVELFYGIPIMLFALIIMFNNNVFLALVMFSVVPIMIGLMLFFNNRIIKHTRIVRKINSMINNYMAEGINGSKTSKTLVVEEINIKNFKEKTSHYYRKNIHLGFLNNLNRPLIEMISSFGTALLVYYGGGSFIQDKISLGTLTLFISYTLDFYDPINQFAFIMNDFQVCVASGERILYLLEEDIDIIDSEKVIKYYGTTLNPKTENYKKLDGYVEFKNVDFYYVKENPVLNNFNLSVKKGESIALVGETGSGKSTIINLLCRFYEPKNGEILIDDINYKEFSIGNLASSIGYVLQNPVLFNGTIASNIRYGKLDASDEEIIEALKLVNAYDFVMKMDNGINSDVGQDGSKISTGQKQLICLARAIIKNPCFFILDEATSFIDVETEVLIQKAIDNILKTKTSFIVAHRLSTIVNVKTILVIETGEIVEKGNHQELIERKGKYYELYKKQFKENDD